MSIKDEKITGHMSPGNLPKPGNDRTKTGTQFWFPDSILAFSAYAIQ